MYKYQLVLVILTIVFSKISACDCSGQGSCDINGNRVENAGGFCDCCLECNSCVQLFSGCLSNKIPIVHPDHTPFLSQFTLNELQHDKVEWGDNLTSACISPALPSGLTLTVSGNYYILGGTPLETLPETNYTIIVRGSQSYARTKIAIIINSSTTNGSKLNNTSSNDSLHLTQDHTARISFPSANAVNDAAVDAEGQILAIGSDRQSLFTSRLAAALSSGAFSGYSVVVCHSRYSITGSHAHYHYELHMTDRSTYGYEIELIPRGQSATFTLRGDGGFINWAFSGSISRSGNTLRFH